MPIRYKLLTALLSLTILGLVTIGANLYVSSEEALSASIDRHLQTTIDLKVGSVNDVIDKYLESFALVTSRTQLRLSLKEYMETGDRSASATVIQNINDARHSIDDFEEIHAVALDGRIIISTSSAFTGTSIAKKDYFIRGKEENVIDAKEVLRGTRKLHLAGPLKLRGETIGVLVVQASTRAIDNVASNYTGLGLTGETVISTKIDGKLGALSPVRFAPTTLFHPLPIDPYEIPDHMQGSVIERDDYRGVPVLALTQRIPNSDWGLIVKIDKSEALKPLAELRDLMIMSLLVATLAALLLSLALSRLLTKPITDLTNVATMIAGGDLQRRILDFPKDELGKLAEAFNQMTDRLIEANATLEGRVREKTEELVKANEELSETNERLERISSVDGLTGIPNRRVLDETLEKEWNRCARAGTPLSFVMMDIDHFKKFNDLAGHQAGDDCLVEVAAIIKACPQRAGDLPARYGGEEFAVILSGTEVENATNVAERIRQSIEGAKIKHPGSDVSPYVTMSVGVATVIPTRDGKPEELMKIADQALYKAKKSGRNRVVVSDESVRPTD